MVDRALSPLPAPKEAPRKEKSYREADTQMRAYIDAQQTAVSNKVDEVMASFKETPLRRRIEKEPPAPDTIRTETPTPPQKRSKAIFLVSAGVILLVLAGSTYYVTSNQPAQRATAAPPPPAFAGDPPSTEAPVAQDIPIIPTTPIDDSVVQHHAPPVQEVLPKEVAPAEPKEKNPVVAKPKKPAKPIKKSTRYSEQL